MPITVPVSQAQIATPRGVQGPLGRTSLAGAQAPLTQGINKAAAAFNKTDRQRKALALSQGQNRALEELNNAELAAKETDPDNAVKDFEGRLNVARDHTFKGIEDAGVSAQLDVFFERQRILRQGKLGGFEATRRESVLQGSTTNALSELAIKRANAIGDTEREAFDAQAKQVADNFKAGSISGQAGETADAMLFKYQNDADVAHAQTMLNSVIHSKKGTKEVLGIFKEGEEFQHLTPKQSQDFVRKAENQIDGIDIDLRRAEAEARQAKKLAQIETANSFYTRIEANDPDNPVTAAEINNDPMLDALGPIGKKAMTKILRDKVNGVEFDTNHFLFNAIARDISTGVPVDYETRIGAQIGVTGGLTPGDAKFLHGLMKSLDSPAMKQERDTLTVFFDSAKAQIDTSTILKGDAKGAALYFNWYVRTQTRLKQGLSDGKSVFQMIDPNSQDFIGSTKDFVRSTAQMGKDLGAEARTGAPGLQIRSTSARKEGESPKAWRERTGRGGK